MTSKIEVSQTESNRITRSTLRKRFTSALNLQPSPYISSDYHHRPSTMWQPTSELAAAVVILLTFFSTRVVAVPVSGSDDNEIMYSRPSRCKS